MNITPELRIVLTNQYRILEMLSQQSGDRSSANEYRTLGDVFQNGIESGYDRAGEYLSSRPSIPAAVSRFVSQVVDMFVELQSAAVELEMAPADIARARFPRFHYAREREHSYASYHYSGRATLRDGSPLQSVKYEEIPARPMVPIYERMLFHWRKSDDPQKLNAKDVKRILAAGE